jgi:membrane protease YdiL (CAAX protease family)
MQQLSSVLFAGKDERALSRFALVCVAWTVFLVPAAVTAFLGTCNWPSQLRNNGWINVLLHGGGIAIGVVILLSKWGPAVSRVGLHFPRHSVSSGRWALLLALTNVAFTSVYFILNLPPVMHLATIGFLSGLFWVSIFSPVVEEFFIRGWFQTAWQDSTASSAVQASALMSASLHLFTYFRGTALSTTLLFFISAYVLGYVTALLKQKSGSLGPPILVHVVYNLTGALVGPLIWRMLH